MNFEDKTTLIQEFVDNINKGDLDVIDRLVDRDFFTYVPSAGEPSAPQVLKELLGDIINAFPDLCISVTNFNPQGQRLICDAAISGSHTNDLWGSPGSGKHAQWTSTITSRFTNGKFAFQWDALPMPELLAALRQIDLVPPPEDMDKPTRYPVSLPEILLKLVFTGQVGDKECSHLGLIRVTEPDAQVCEKCVQLGDEWPSLRLCLICGHIGCCDTSKNKHAKKHVEESGHTLVRSIRMQESWVWCYECSAFFSGQILADYR